MNVFVVMAFPPRGRDEPWVSDVFDTAALAKAYATDMEQMSEGVVYVVEQHKVRQDLDVHVDQQTIDSEPFFKGLDED